MKKILMALFMFSLSSLSFSSENIWYALRYHTDDRMCSPEDTFTSLKAHYQKISLLIPQAYSIDETGEVLNGIQPEIQTFATTHHMKIMPLVTNKKFDSESAHRFLTNAEVQTKALEKLIALCKENHFVGMQLDFEMIKLSDRDLLTQFYQRAADLFHAAHFKISFAVAPVVTDQPSSLFLKKIYENWEGAYDLEKLGKIADFISIMAYNQHGGVTTPGATASLPWVKESVLYALRFIPANKISIGIADYSTHWYTDSVSADGKEKVAVKMRGLNFARATQLAQQFRVQFAWDKESANRYGIYLHNWLNEYIFLEDARSFKAKHQLVKQYKLRGISVFDLGTEDPEVWKVL